MSIKTEHKGYKIEYFEHADAWGCYELELDGKSLASLKAKINKIDMDARRLDRIPIIVLDGWGGEKYGVALSWATQKSVWVMAGGRRSKESCDKIVTVTAEVQAVLARVKTLRKQATELNEQAKAITGAIPRWQPSEKNVADDEEIVGTAT